MVKPILSNLIMELNWMALLLKVRHREKQWIPTWYLHTQCIVLQTSTPNVKMENLPAHLFQVKITPEVYIGVSLVHINQKCVTIIFQSILKKLSNHKSQTWFSFQVIVVTADMSNAQVVLNAYQNPTFVMATMTVETIPGLMNKVAGNSLFLPFWCLCFAMRWKSNSEMRNSFWNLLDENIINI